MSSCRGLTGRGMAIVIPKDLRNSFHSRPNVASWATSHCNFEVFVCKILKKENSMVQTGI